ncbi:hypothetical protein [Planomicrobium okeanokoites]|uniref:hypothetical protein n=1 Tax=Planomicrobium okeanokoites TaxID=244 RepID=UPI000A01E1C8|nr:hypothetical protein [Planomicrobium okeanokoites]
MVFSSVLFESMLEGFWPILTAYILPIGLWMLVPAVILRLIFKSKLSFQVGALIGLALCFFIGPFST